MRLLPIGQVRIGPATASRFYVDPDVARRIEMLINRFTKMVGFGTVAVDGRIDPTDADRVARVQRFLYERFVCDKTMRAAARAQFDEDLAYAGELAEEEPGGDPPTAEQMWVAMNQDRIADQLEQVGDEIDRGERKPCPVDWKTPLVIVGGVALAAVLLGGSR